jgi:hypothetical protein
VYVVDNKTYFFYMEKFMYIYIFNKVCLSNLDWDQIWNKAKHSFQYLKVPNTENVYIFTPVIFKLCDYNSAMPFCEIL